MTLRTTSRAVAAVGGSMLLLGLHLAPAAADAAVELFTPTDPQLSEISGVTPDPAGGSYWVNQDAGREQLVYLLDASGDTVATVRPTGLKTEDTEDLALLADGEMVLGDTGDAFQLRKEQGNPKSRTRYQLVVFAVPEAGATTSVIDSPARSVPYEFPDGATRNVEGFAVDQETRAVYLFEKLQKPGDAGVWRIQLDESGLQQAKAVASIPIIGISSAVMGPDRAYVALRDADSAYLFPVTDGDVAAALDGKPTIVRLPEQPQGEALAVSRAATDLVVASEGAGQPFWAVPLPDQFVVAVPAVPVAGKTGPGNPTTALALAALSGLLGVTIIGYGMWRKSQELTLPQPLSPELQ